MLRLTRLAGVLLAMLGLVSNAQAQEFSSTPIKYFTAESLSAVLGKLGAQQVTSGKDQEGDTIVRFEAGEVKYTAIIVACKNQPGCLGLLLGVPVSVENGTFSHDVVNGFNDALPFAKAVRTNDGKAVVLFRYIISDGGVLEANLATNIAVFSALPGVFAKYLSRQVVASVEQTRPMPMSVVVTSPSPTAPALSVPGAGVHESLEPYLKRFAKEPPYKLP